MALARALINRPTVLLLDEPLAALDRKLRRDMQIELQNLQREVGITFVLVTHDQEEALSMSDTICIMRDGRIVQTGSPPRALRRAGQPLGRRLCRQVQLSSPARSRPAGRAGRGIALRGPMVAAGAAGPPRGARRRRAVIAVRPEVIRLGLAPPAAADRRHRRPGTCCNRIFLGEHTEYLRRARGALGDLLALVPRDGRGGAAGFAPGRCGGARLAPRAPRLRSPTTGKPTRHNKERTR